MTEFDDKPMSVVRVESPFPAHAVPRIWTWIERFRNRVADDFAPQTLEEFAEDCEEVLLIFGG